MDTLVLSQDWKPVARIPWQRAITQIWKGVVEVVEEYEDWSVKSVTLELKVPSVVRILRGLVRRRKAIKFSRENVYARDRGKCQYCSSRLTRQEATYDHVLPRHKGGKTTWDNIVIACVPCNQKKGGKTPEQAKMALLSTPVRPKKLDPTMKFTFTWDKGMPKSWASYLRDVSYWHGELEE